METHPTAVSRPSAKKAWLLVRLQENQKLKLNCCGQHKEGPIRGQSLGKNPKTRTKVMARVTKPSSVIRDQEPQSTERLA